jgi:hypothetical protein
MIPLFLIEEQYSYEMVDLSKKSETKESVDGNPALKSSSHQ